MPSGMGANFIASPAGGFEPTRTFNWLFEAHLPSFDDQELIALSLETGFVPDESNEEIEVFYMNERVYVAGKALYNQGTLSLKDWVDRDTYGAIYRWRRLTYNPDTGQIGYARDYKLNARMLLLGPDGTNIKSWLMWGTWVQSVNQVPLDMAASDIVKVECVLRYDKAYPEFIGDQGVNVLGIL